jgi:NAD(P)-dependent dehydrogenase (short-subunit alcohol dehydrogenase family)
MTTTALVTGANKGLGLATARQLAALGITVVMAARDPERGRAAADELGQPFVELDVTDEASVQAAAAWIEQTYGKLDILVNNAGITVAPECGVPSTVSLDDVRRVFETNVFGVIAVTNAMLPLLLRSPAGRIVNVSSEVGSLTRMLDRDSPLWSQNNLPYSCAKAAMNMLTVAYAKELWDTPVKVNSEAPGFCATEINGYRGFRSAEEGAEVAVRFATLDDDGPTGTFHTFHGQLPW